MKFTHINLSFTAFAATAACGVAPSDKTLSMLAPLAAADLDCIGGNGTMIDWGLVAAPVGGSKPAD